MAKRKLTVTNEYGTFTRSTDRTYTHLIISTGPGIAAYDKAVKGWEANVAGLKALIDDPATLKSESGGVTFYYSSKGSMGRSAATLTSWEKSLKVAIKRREDKLAGKYIALSWHSRRDLADKAAADWTGRGYEQVRIIPIS